MAPSKHLNDLLYETMKDIYFAEKQILKALPAMAEAAQSPNLKAAFETHRGQTEEHVQRLDQAFELIGKPDEQKTCNAILGIIEEGKDVMEEFHGTDALDPAFWQAHKRSSTMRSADMARW